MNKLLLLFIAASLGLIGQTSTPPSTCIVGENFIDASSKGEWFCAATNTWTYVPISPLVFTQVNVPNGVAGLDSNKKLDPSVIPATSMNANTLQHGVGAPSPSLGLIGDFYVDTSVPAWYGPKSLVGWGTPYALSPGPTGATGPAGPTGPTGPAGTAATILPGTVTILPSGSTPTVTNSGSPNAAVFNFGIPSVSSGGSVSPTIIIDAQSQFGILGDGTTDNTTAFLSLNSTLRTVHGIPEVDLPSGTILTSWSDPFFGVPNLILKGQGRDKTHLVNSAVATSPGHLSFIIGAQDFRCQTYTGSTLSTNYDDFTNVLINSVSAGSYSATAATPSQVASWAYGDDVLFTGFDQQGDSSYPPNYRYFDRVIVQSVNYLTGVVTFDKPLSNSYNSAWPFFAATNTTAPAMRNFTHGACPTGGTITPMQFLLVQGVDFSQLPSGQSGYTSSVIIGDVRHSSLVDTKFDALGPTTTQEFEFINSVANHIEIDKLIDVAYLKHATIGLNPVDTNYQSLGQGTGANWIIVDDSTVIDGYINLSPRNLVIRNSNIHASSPYGWVSNAGWYTRSQLLDNNTLFKDGKSILSLYSGNALSAITATATPTSSTFTVAASGDVITATRILGPGSEIRGSNSTSPSAILGIVNDVYLVGGVLTVSGTWSGTITPGETVYIDSNPITNIIIHPILADFVLSAVTPAWNFGGPNFITELGQQGNGTSVQMALGPVTATHCTMFDSNSNIVDSGSTCADNNLYNIAHNPVPVCGLSTLGKDITVTDAVSLTWMGPYYSGGALTSRVICSYNGTSYSWLTH